MNVIIEPAKASSAMFEYDQIEFCSTVSTEQSSSLSNLKFCNYVMKNQHFAVSLSPLTFPKCTHQTALYTHKATFSHTLPHTEFDTCLLQCSWLTFLECHNCLQLRKHREMLPCVMVKCYTSIQKVFVRYTAINKLWVLILCRSTDKLATAISATG